MNLVRALDLKNYGNLLLPAVMEPGQPRPLYNPKPDYTLKAGDTLVFQANAEDFERFKKKFPISS